ncbi:MAG: DUF4160 domain-containing protein [Pyrinomonadaceae bacterium]|nr:DUF4160 domain-containing protein [Pyrinomonadaceae bacterium]
MPTILIKSGFRFIINTDDHEPMHVHAIHEGRSVLIEFENEIKVRRNRGVSERNISRMIRIIEANQSHFQER